MVFDDSFEHEVLHEGDEARTVLLVNFWHPDVPPEMFTGNVWSLGRAADVLKR